MDAEKPPEQPHELLGDHRAGLLQGQKRPTLKTIAEITGLAIATVSRALKDAPDIGENTKKRVRSVAKDIGYRPNRAGVRLRTGKTNVICLVMSTEEHVMNHTAQLIYSVSTALRDSPYHLIITPVAAGDDPMDPIRYIVETGSADGVIINQLRPNDPRVKYMNEHGIPFATHGRTEMGISHPYFDFDNERFTELAVEKLVSLGRKNLALLAPPEDQTYGKQMIQGFVKTAEKLNVNFQVFDTVNSDCSIADIQHEVSKAIHAPNPPDAIISGATSAAMAVVTAAEDAGLELGKELDVLAKEAVHFLRHFRKEMIVVQENVGQAGTFLVKALMASIEKSGPHQQGLETPSLDTD
ncbi:MAG: LacI family DNA-binding transcriptional regulator [Hyphomicrobiales bacterium]